MRVSNEIRLRLGLTALLCLVVQAGVSLPWATSQHLPKTWRHVQAIRQVGQVPTLARLNAAPRRSSFSRNKRVAPPVTWQPLSVFQECCFSEVQPGDPARPLNGTLGRQRGRSPPLPL